VLAQRPHLGRVPEEVGLLDGDLVDEALPLGEIGPALAGACAKSAEAVA
jgi:hypothetical protein